MFCLRTLKKSALASAVLGLVILASHGTAKADPITVCLGAGCSAQNVSGSIVAGNGTVTITLNNNLTNAQVLNVTNNISAVYFQVSGYNLGAVSLSSSNSAASTLVAADGAAVLGPGFNPTGWAAGNSGTTVTVCDVCAFGIGGAAGPANTIIGGTGTGTGGVGGTGYVNANNSIAGNGPHNPFLVGTTTFTLLVPGVTVNSTFSNVVVQFGTVPNPPTTNVPEPASMLLLGTGLLGVAGGLRRRRNKKV